MHFIAFLFIRILAFSPLCSRQSFSLFVIPPRRTEYAKCPHNFQIALQERSNSRSIRLCSPIARERSKRSRAFARTTRRRAHFPDTFVAAFSYIIMRAESPMALNLQSLSTGRREANERSRKRRKIKRNVETKSSTFASADHQL